MSVPKKLELVLPLWPLCQTLNFVIIGINAGRKPLLPGTNDKSMEDWRSSGMYSGFQSRYLSQIYLLNRGARLERDPKLYRGYVLGVGNFQI